MLPCRYFTRTFTTLHMLATVCFVRADRKTVAYRLVSTPVVGSFCQYYLQIIRVPDAEGTVTWNLQVLNPTV